MVTRIQTSPGRRLAAFVLLTMLAGCAGADDLGDVGSVKPTSQAPLPVASAASASVPSTPLGLWSGGVTMLVVTTRSGTGSPLAAPWFGKERAADPTAAKAILYPPQNSLLSSLNPATSAAWQVAGVQRLPGSEAAASVAQASEGRDVLLYVHGFNETFESASSSYAKLVSDLGFSGAPILFTWPSAGALFDYGYDRDSALGSRDALEDTITALAKDPRVGRIHVLAHSMGGMLTLEALRSVFDQNGPLLANRLGAIVLANPDVDLDLFKRQAKRMAALAPKMTVIISGNDRALELSSKLSGGVARVGMADRAMLEQTGVSIVDASDFGSGWINHDIFMSRPELHGVIQRALDNAADTPG